MRQPYDYFEKNKSAIDDKIAQYWFWTARLAKIMNGGVIFFPKFWFHIVFWFYLHGISLFKSKQW